MKTGLPQCLYDRPVGVLDMLVTSFDQLERGSVFHGRYRVERRLGAGAMGAVYEVVDEKTQSLRALKVMQPDLVRDPVHRERFAQEAQITGKIESDHLVRVLDAGIDPMSSMPFLTMELLRGETLGREIERRRALPIAEAKRYLQQISFGLMKTHAAGIVHRDLKPDNLFVTMRDDGSPSIKILDFGIAKVVARSQPAAATRVGTPLYMAPEQLDGKGTIGPPTDIHALGHLAYEMLVGEPYWAEEMRCTEGVMPFFEKLLKGPIESPSGRAKRRCDVTLPLKFDAWFSRCIAHDPADRYSSVVEFMQAFAHLDDNKATWMARTVAAGPLVQAFDESQLYAKDSSEIVTTLPRPNSNRDLDAATTTPRLPQRTTRNIPMALVGAAVTGCLFVVLIILNVGVTKTKLLPVEPSALPTAGGSVAPESAPPTLSAIAEVPEMVETPAVSASATIESTPPQLHHSMSEPPAGRRMAEHQSGAGEFNRAAASSALNAAAAAAKACKKPNGPTGTAKVKVTFAPSGKVTASQVQGPPFAGTAVGNCIAAAFRSAKMPPFDGSPVSPTKSVTVN